MHPKVSAKDGLRPNGSFDCDKSVFLSLFLVQRPTAGNLTASRHVHNHVKTRTLYRLLEANMPQDGGVSPNVVASCFPVKAPKTQDPGTRIHPMCANEG